ncbi:MAG: bifunctional riboflavin kinase/FAD synthetase [Chloroflexi bacterium]|nr:bifunctional riboflavin kinase/FAD synthetase [Chloroflexota bacterium]
MRVHQELSPQLPRRNTVLAVGVFDGVHVGHRHLLKCLKEAASQRGLLSGVVTFINHPHTVLAPGTLAAGIKYITSFQDRLALLESTGVDMVIPLTFDVELSRLSARDFTDLLQERLSMVGLVMGPNFAMGHKREGNPQTLKAIGDEKGFSVTIVEPITNGGDRISSTAIRQAISDGDMDRASRYLGRPFTLHGRVLAGDSRGRTLGFPTANLGIPKDLMIPGDGIYATWACVGNQRHMAATNIGVKPTFGTKERTIEAFLLDFSGDLYDSEMTLEFAQRLRDELRFETPEALMAQIRRDVEYTRKVLKDPLAQPTLTLETR